MPNFVNGLRFLGVACGRAFRSYLLLLRRKRITAAIANAGIVAGLCLGVSW